MYPFPSLPIPTPEASTWTPTTAAWFLRFRPTEARTFAFANLAAACGWLPILRRLKSLEPLDPDTLTFEYADRVTFDAPRTTTRFTTLTLRHAATAGHLPIVEFLLSECGIEPNTATLHAAAAGGHLAVFNRLAPVTAGPIDGATLALAAASGNAELVRVLLADTLGTRRHAIGEAALAAASSPRADDAVVETLLARLPRSWYPRGIGDAMAAGGRVRILRELLDTGKDAWEGDLPWFTRKALLKAVDGGEAEVVRLVLENLPSSWLVRSTGPRSTAVERAARRGRLDLVRMICEWPTARGPSARVVDSVAASAGLGVVRYLVEKQNCGYTETAFEEAAKNGCLDVLQFLLEDVRDKDPPELWVPLYYAIKNGHSAVVHFLLSHLRSPAGAYDGAHAGAAFLPTTTLAYASAQGHANLAAALLATYPITPTHPALAQSVRRCQPAAACVLAGSFRAAIAAVPPRGSGSKGWWKPRGAGCSSQHLERACDAAVASGHVEVVVMLVDTMHVRRPRLYTVSAESLKDAAAGGHVNVFRYLAGEEGVWENGRGRRPHRRALVEFIRHEEWGRIVGAAARAGHLDVVRMLVEDAPADWRRFMLHYLCRWTPTFPHEVTAYIVRVYCSWPHARVTAACVAHAVIRNDMDRLRLLSERFPDKILWTVSFMRLALAKRSWGAMGFCGESDPARQRRAMQLRHLLLDLPNELLQLVLLTDGDLLRSIEIEHHIARLHHPATTTDIDLLDDLDASHFSASLAIYPFPSLTIPTPEASTWTPITAAWFLRFRPTEARTFAFANLAAARGCLPILRRLKALEPLDPGPPLTFKLNGVTFDAPRTTTRFTTLTLRHAATAGHLPVVEFLLSECGITPTTAALHAAAAGGHLAVFNRLSAVTPGPIDGATLALAAASGNAELVRVLLAGPLRTRRYAIGAAAVAAAASPRAEDAVVEMLLAKLPREWYPRGIGDAVAAGGRVRMLRELLQRGADVWEGDLPWFTGVALLSAVDGGEAEAVQLVLENTSVGWLCAGGRGNDAVRQAAKRARLDLVRMICERGVELRLRDSLVDSVAGYAGLDVVKYLVEEQECGYSERAAVEAAGNGCLDVVQFLIEDARDKERVALWKALHHAIKNGHTSVVHFLLSQLQGPAAASLPTTTLPSASAHNHAALVSSLLAAHPTTPTHAALTQSVRHCHPATARVLAGSFRAAIAAVAPRFQIEGLVKASRRGLRDEVCTLLDTVAFEPRYLVRACDVAVAGGHVGVLVELADAMRARRPGRRPYRVSARCLMAAAAGGHVNVFRHLAGGELPHRRPQMPDYMHYNGLATELAIAAARAGHLDVVQLLVEDAPAEWRCVPYYLTLRLATFPHEVVEYLLGVYCGRALPGSWLRVAVIRNDVDGLRLLSARLGDMYWHDLTLGLALARGSWEAFGFVWGKRWTRWGKAWTRNSDRMIQVWMRAVAEEEEAGRGVGLEGLDGAMEVCLWEFAEEVRAAAVACGLVRWVAHLDSRGWCSSQPPDAQVDEGAESTSTE
ncbi:hypothetical protein HDU96_011127 [Phlyctochytrium bullatum]|nr:hypothetical protein HDU96_011127 [Phlyctochytrium bullatum]